jgi:hypothetical protein
MEARSLMARPHGNIAEISAIPTIRQGPCGADGFARIEREDAKHAVAEHEFEVGGRLVAKRRRAIQR